MNEVELKETVVRHESVITTLEKSIQKIEISNERQDEKMTLILEAMNKNMILVEKIEHIDESNKEAIKRVHKRIDEGFEQLKIISQKAEKGNFMYSLFIAISTAIPLVTTIIAGILYLIENNKLK